MTSSFTFLLRLLSFAFLTFDTVQAEILYNGIALPAKWPPNRSAQEIASREPMPVPYLRKPPAVIPIDVGRQLFVDDFLIETTNLRRTWHKPEYHQGNPELYALDAVGYESVMLAAMVIWHYHEPGRPKINEIYFSFSRDGFHYSRGSYEPMLPTSPDKDAWNAGNVQSAVGVCCIVGDRLYFYCSGRSSDPNNLSNENELPRASRFCAGTAFARWARPSAGN